MKLVVSAATDKKAEEIVVLDLQEMGSITDHFIVCHGRGTRQVQAIADSIEKTLKDRKIRPDHIEGYPAGEWVLMDYVDFVVHIFSADKRKYYDLEKLWSNARQVAIESGPQSRPV